MKTGDLEAVVVDEVVATAVVVDVLLPTADPMVTTACSSPPERLVATAMSFEKSKELFPLGLELGDVRKELTLSGGGPVVRGTGGSGGSFFREVSTPSGLSDSCSKAIGCSVISLSPPSFRQEHAGTNVSDVMAILVNFLASDSH